jgi:glycosyltransferase involved in cell wall biosynthesis
MTDKPSMLWHSNAPWSPTGYGNQTGLFAPLLNDHYDLAVSAFYGLDGARLVWNGIPVFPGLSGTYGNEYLLDHADNHFGGELRGGTVVTLMDVWVLHPGIVKQMDVACWVPVDHEPAPPRVTEFFRQSNAVPIAMSRFGQDELANAGLEPLYCPHGVDTETYRPHDKQECRDLFGFPQDEFLVGMVAANKGASPSRKGFQQAFQAFRIFNEKYTDSALYLHTVMDGKFSQGEPLPEMMRGLGVPADRVRSAVQYNAMYDPLPARVMAKLYSCFDVLLSPSMGEGFGIPIMEAAACGVPAVATNFSAIPEVAGPAAWLVGCESWWTGQGSFQAVADVSAVAEALERAFWMSQAEAKKRSEMCREHAEGYDHRKVFTDHMLPSLKAAQERFGDRAPLEAVAA